METIKYIFKIYYVINYIIVKIKINSKFLIRLVIKIIIKKIKRQISRETGGKIVFSVFVIRYFCCSTDMGGMQTEPPTEGTIHSSF
jgi:hypothetical protein